MKTKCVNCHFLSKEYREENSGRVLSFSLSMQEREKLKSNDDKAISEYYSCKCHMGVWDEGVTKEISRLEQITVTKRENCFYYPYQIGMLFKAAEELQKREQERKEMKKSNMYTRIGLWVASGGLFLNAIIGWLRLKYGG